MTDPHPSKPYSLLESDKGFGSILVLHGSWQSSFAEVLDGEGVRALRLSDRVGWPPEDLEFLRGMTLRSLEVCSDTRIDLTAVEAMTSLEWLGLDCEATRPLDLSQLTGLTHALVTWPKRGIAHLLDRPELEHLSIEKYPHGDLRALEARRLKRLDLTSRKLESLHGVSQLPSLVRFDLLDCYKLESIDDLAGTSVEVLEIENCRKVGSLEPLQGHRSLRRLILNGCAGIESLEPLGSCEKLELVILGGNTNITTGDLALLLNNPRLKTFRFKNRRHYNLKSKDVDALLMERRRARRPSPPEAPDANSLIEALAVAMEDEDTEAIDALLSSAPPDADAKMIERALGLIRQELAGVGEWQIMVFLEALPARMFFEGLFRGAAVLGDQSPYALRAILQRRLEQKEQRDALVAYLVRRPEGMDVVTVALRELALTHSCAGVVLQALGGECDAC